MQVLILNFYMRKISESHSKLFLESQDLENPVTKAQTILTSKLSLDSCTLELDSMQILFGAALFSCVKCKSCTTDQIWGKKGCPLCSKSFFPCFFVACLGCRTAKGPILHYPSASSCLRRLT